MRNILLPVAAAALILSSVAATPAQADCAEDIEKLEKRFLMVGDGIPWRSSVLSFIVVAKDALEKGKKIKCGKMVKKADKLLAKFDY